MTESPMRAGRICAGAISPTLVELGLARVHHAAAGVHHAARYAESERHKNPRDAACVEPATRGDRQIERRHKVQQGTEPGPLCSPVPCAFSFKETSS